MAVLESWLPDLASSPAPLLWVAAGILTAVVVVAAAVFAVRHSLKAGGGKVVWRGALVLVGLALVWAWLDRSAGNEQAAARRALDARTAELTARAIAPGSALACLDAVANASVEAACEKALFASPEAVAAAVAYVDARLTLLADGLQLAARDRSYEAALERLRRGIEADRFGFVAHVLATRGCSASECAAFKLMREPQRVIANLNERTFDANVVLHTAGWRGDGPAVATAPAAGAPALAGASAPTGVPVSSKYDFPSAASIPPVSIMNAEPAAPPSADANAPPAAPSGSRPGTTGRRQSAREAAPPAPPVPLTPPAAGPTMAQPGNSQNLR